MRFKSTAVKVSTGPGVQATQEGPEEKPVGLAGPLTGEEERGLPISEARLVHF